MGEESHFSLIKKSMSLWMERWFCSSNAKDIGTLYLIFALLSSFFSDLLLVLFFIKIPKPHRNINMPLLSSPLPSGGSKRQREDFELLESNKKPRADSPKEESDGEQSSEAVEMEVDTPIEIEVERLTLESQRENNSPAVPSPTENLPPVPSPTENLPPVPSPTENLPPVPSPLNHAVNESGAQSTHAMDQSTNAMDQSTNAMDQSTNAINQSPVPGDDNSIFGDYSGEDSDMEGEGPTVSQLGSPEPGNISPSGSELASPKPEGDNSSSGSELASPKPEGDNSPSGSESGSAIFESVPESHQESLAVTANEKGLVHKYPDLHGHTPESIPQLEYLDSYNNLLSIDVSNIELTLLIVKLLLVIFPLLMFVYVIFTTFVRKPLWF